MQRHVLISALLIAASTACEEPKTSADSSKATVTGTAIAAPASTKDNGVSPDQVVARWNGGQLRYAEAEEDIAARLLQAEIEYLQTRHQTQLQSVQANAIEALVQLEAKSRGLDEEALFAQEIDAKVQPPTEAEIAEFYQVIRRRLRNKPLEEVRGEVEQMLLQRKMTERLQEFTVALSEKYALTIDLPYPDLPRIAMATDGDPSFGPEDAPVTIVEFGDYECGYCGRAFATVQKIQEAYPDKVRVVYRDFPLDFHARAIPAAVAANCAGVQNRYWDLHDVLMSNQGALSDDDLARHATSIGLDMDAWQDCYTNSSEQQAEIAKDYKEGQEAGVSGTPAFFVNGIFLSGALPFDQFETIIERELAG